MYTYLGWFQMAARGGDRLRSDPAPRLQPGTILRPFSVRTLVIDRADVFTSDIQHLPHVPPHPRYERHWEPDIILIAGRHHLPSMHAHKQ